MLLSLYSKCFVFMNDRRHHHLGHHQGHHHHHHHLVVVALLPRLRSHDRTSGVNFSNGCKWKMQVRASLCKLQVCTSCCKFVQAFANLCKLLQVCASSCKFVQVCVSCKRKFVQVCAKYNFVQGLRLWHESLQPCSRAARKWKENEEMKRKWR